MAENIELCAAFPVATIDGYTQYGMTLRDYFAAKALAALILKDKDEGAKRGAQGVPIMANWAYEYADAMLIERAALNEGKDTP